MSINRAALFLIAAFALWAGPTLASIEISPLRAVISNQEREAVFTVSNPTGRIMEARASWVDLTATETGYIDAPPAARARLSAAPYLLLSPAQFRLEPGARIEMRIALKEGSVAPRGEHRSHLLIEAAASRTHLRKAGNQGLQVDIGVGLSVPVLLRGHGKAAAEIGKTRLLRDEDSLLYVSTEIKAKGAHSSYGRLIASFAPDDPNAEPIALGERRNVAGFLDAPARRIDIPLGVYALGEGELSLRYIGESEFEGVLFDERPFVISPPD